MTKTKILILTSQFNQEITSNLLTGARKTLIQGGIHKADIAEISVPGAFELPSLAAKAAASGHWAAIICLGCVIKGDTDHYDYICQAVSHGIMSVSIQYKMPVIFGVLTTQNSAQAIARSSLEEREPGPALLKGQKPTVENKGHEAAAAALLALKNLEELNNLAV